MHKLFPRMASTVRLAQNVSFVHELASGLSSVDVQTAWGCWFGWAADWDGGVHGGGLVGSCLCTRFCFGIFRQSCCRHGARQEHWRHTPCRVAGSGTEPVPNARA